MLRDVVRSTRITDVSALDQRLTDQDPLLHDIELLWVVDQALEVLHELRVNTHVRGQDGLEQELAELRAGLAAIEQMCKTMSLHDR